MELGSAGIMRAYMAQPCDEALTLERKIQLFLTMSLPAYRAPTLAMRYEFSLSDLTQPGLE